MTIRKLIVDGMLSGTGVRDGVAGGYVEPNELGLSGPLTKRLNNWLRGFENAHYRQFVDKTGTSDWIEKESKSPS